MRAVPELDANQVRGLLQTEAVSHEVGPLWLRWVPLDEWLELWTPNGTRITYVEFSA